MAASTSPFTTVWFYNSDTGSVISEPALGDTIQAHLPGWHGPFGTKQEALNYYTANAKANPSWKAPTGLAGNVGNEAGQAAGAGSSALLGTLAEFLGVGKISGTNLVLRGTKIIIGGILVIVGLVHITGLSGTVADTARRLPLPI